MEYDKVSVPQYDKADRDHMRRLLKKAIPIIDLIATDQVPFGSYESAELIDSLAATIVYENEKLKDDDELQELKDDSYSLVNLYGAIKKIPTFIPLYVELGKLLRHYGLFDEEVVLLENAVATDGFSDEDLADIKDRLNRALAYREADDERMSDSDRIAENLQRLLQKKPLDEKEITALLEQCTDDTVLYNIACDPDEDKETKYIREKAARLIHSRDYRYALSSHLSCDARTSMILDLHSPLEGDKTFITRTILTDPNDENKAHMLIYCRDESLLMLGWLYVYGARWICEDRLHDMGSRFPEAYQEMSQQNKESCVQELLGYAAKLALDLFSEDENVRERLSNGADVDSEPLHFFLSIHHPKPAIRLQHARKLKNPARIAYVGSWTSDDQIKESLSVKIDSTMIITEMIYGDLSGVDLIFGFRKPEDLTLQDRFCVEIMKNNPDRRIREHVRTELLKGDVQIQGVDLTKPDTLFIEPKEESSNGITDQIPDRKTVYVCYSKLDEEYGKPVVKTLNSMDLRVYDRCDESECGEDFFSESYQEQTKKTIRDVAEHGCFLFLLSRYSKQDLIMKKELEYAMMYDAPVVIAFLGISEQDLSSDFRYLVSRIPGTNVDEDDHDCIERIISLVDRTLHKFDRAL